MTEKPISSRELIQRCGQDPDEPLGRIEFPSEMRMRPATDGEAQRGLNDTWPGDPVPMTRTVSPSPEQLSDLAGNLHRLAKWCQAKDPNATIWLHAIEAADALESTQAEIARLTTALNTPEVDDWAKGAALEAAHQRERWGVDHDAGKTPFDWFWLVGYLAQKAAASAVAGDTEKAKHHTISTAAALANWHLSLSGTDNRMRPGIDPVLAQNRGAGLSDPPNDTEREQAA